MGFFGLVQFSLLEKSNFFPKTHKTRSRSRLFSQVKSLFHQTDIDPSQLLCLILILNFFFFFLIEMTWMLQHNTSRQQPTFYSFAGILTACWHWVCLFTPLEGTTTLDFLTGIYGEWWNRIKWITGLYSSLQQQWIIQ